MVNTTFNIESLQADNKQWQAKADYLEKQSRINNIVIDGIPE